LKAVRVADCYDDLACAYALRIAQAHGHKVACGYSYHCQVSVRIVSDYLRPVAATVCERDFHGRGLVNDMAVGQYESVRREDEA
jgi:hypothetical protein